MQEDSGTKTLEGIAASTAAGGAAGALTYATVGGVGVAAAGTAVGITLAPFVAIGAGVGLVGWGLYSLGKRAR
jgi:hypothetical protein